ncbi:MAG TPA: biosynthetic-type acetolactate synthase large subunit [Candidatus Saccharimonadales bacterium]|jgi:acetolactate synthase-1/2/3 large subunit
MTTKEQTLDGAQALIKTLELLDVEYIFGYSGGAVIPIFDAIVTTKTSIKLIASRHEQGAVHMADGYARATGKPGVVLVTSGPGAGNAITGLMTAHMDSVPMVLISGQQITSMLGLDAFQETDVINLSMPVVKHSYQILGADDIPQIVREAFSIASSGRPGPVVIDIPKDISSAPYKAGAATLQVADKTVVQLSAAPADTVSVSTGLQSIADAVSRAKRPLLLVGQGVLISGAAKALRGFAEQQQIPVVTTLLGKGAIDETDLLSLGMLGMHGTAYANFAITETDCLINIGSRFDDRIVGEASVFASQATICHIDIDATEINKMVATDYSAICDAKYALEQLENLVKPRARPDWLARIADLKAAYPLSFVASDQTLSQQCIINTLTKLTDGEAVVCTDVGQHQMWAAQFYKTKHPRHWLSSGGAGTMGFGMPAALGAQLGRPDQLVISISGDGGFQMTEYELATAANLKLPIKIIILDNKCLGMVRQWQEMFYDNRESGISLHGNPDFALLAQAYGIKTFHIAQSRDAKQQLQSALDYNDGPVVVWCEVEKADNIYPMIPAGRSYAHMMLEAPAKKLEKPIGST